MRSIPGIIKFIVFLGVVAGIGIGIGWLATRPKSSGPETTAGQSGADEFKPVPAPKATGPQAAGPAGAANNPGAASPAGNAAAAEHWEDKIGDVLASDSDVTNKCAELLEIFPHLPEAGQVEAAHHLSNLVGNEGYEPLAKILTDPSTSTNVDDVLMMDAMNRPGSLKLPTLLEVARNPSHPEAAEARSKLALYLEEDYGTDWDKWDAKIKEWLTANPD